MSKSSLKTVQGPLRFMMRHPLLRRLIYAIQRSRCTKMLDHIAPFIPSRGRVLSVGAGTLNETELLLERGYEAVGLDVVDISVIEGLRPVLYDGRRMPFPDDSFDTALILTALHHAHDPPAVVRESKRLAPRIVIMEDVFKGTLHKYLTWWWDSLMNLEFAGHPHTNRDDAGWRALFEALDLELVDRRDRWAFGIMWQVTYVLERR